MTNSAKQWVKIGRIVAAHGIRGEVKINAYTHPVENFAEYSPIYLSQKDIKTPVELSHLRFTAKGIVAKLHDCHDRNQAEALRGTDIFVEAEQLAPTEEDEYYWHELTGLEVINQDNMTLGLVDRFMETGSNDVMIVKGEKEHLIPYIKDVIITVDLEGKAITVNWDPDF